MTNFENLSIEERKTAVKYGHQNLFATRDTLQEALDYFYSLIDACGHSDKAGLLVALQVMINTYAVHIAGGDDESGK